MVLFALSFLSGMLGIGVAFVAIPALGLFGFELKDVIMPWALWLKWSHRHLGGRHPYRGRLFMAKRVKSVVLKRAFAALLVALAFQRAFALWS
jgi:uncharacterized membrane protein YfcA